MDIEMHKERVINRELAMNIIDFLDFFAKIAIES